MIVSVPYVQIVKISSWNLFQSVGWKWYCKAAASNLDIAISLYEQDIYGPCTLPSVCRKFLLLKIELLYFKQSSKPSEKHSFGVALVDLFNKTDFTASKPDLYHLIELAFEWLIDDAMFVCLLNELVIGFCYSDLTLENGEFELSSAITLVLQANRLTKCPSYPKKQRQIRKYNRDNLVIKTYKKKNRRFSRKQLCANLKDKRGNRRDKQKQNIVKIKETAPDRNAISI